MNYPQDFNETMFISKVNNIFVKLLTAIMQNNLKTVDHFISDEVMLYAEDIIKKAQSQKGIPIFDEINVKSTVIKSCKLLNNVYQINVLLQSKYLEYIIDIDSKEKISGDDKNRKEVNYELIFEKKVEVKTAQIARKCPGCGAPISVNTSGLCAYCGAIYNTEDYDWVLKSIKKL